LDTGTETFEKIKDKIVNIIRYWERFKLSLPGRITIAKTFLISQLNYVGCFLPAPANIIEEIQVLLDGFVKKNCLISRERMVRCPTRGGVGMFCLRNFLQAQKCTWISRSVKFPIDNWQYDLALRAPLHRIELLRPIDINGNQNPILYGLAVAYRHFYGEFSKVNGNYRCAYIFDNPAFTVGPNFTETLKADSLGRNFYLRHTNAIRTLKYSDCFTNNHFKSHADFQRGGLPLTQAAWMQLRTCILHARDLLVKNDEHLDKKSDTISNFLSRRKGSKKFRYVLDLAINHNAQVTELRSVRTFFGLIDLPVPTTECLIRFLPAWNYFSMNNSFREFSFKLRYNSLALNSRINAFDNGADPRCGFCCILDPDTRIRESFAHIFLNCHTVTNILQEVMQFFFELVLTRDEFLKFYWTGTLIDCDHLQSIFIFFGDTVRYTIYRYKIRNKVPNHLMVCRDVIFLTKTNLLPRWKEKLSDELVLARLAQRLE
jgi:hypothetical protein